MYQETADSGVCEIREATCTETTQMPRGGPYLFDTYRTRTRSYHPAYDRVKENVTTMAMRNGE